MAAYILQYQTQDFIQFLGYYRQKWLLNTMNEFARHSLIKTYLEQHFQKFASVDVHGRRGDSTKYICIEIRSKYPHTDDSYQQAYTDAIMIESWKDSIKPLTFWRKWASAPQRLINRPSSAHTFLITEKKEDEIFKWLIDEEIPPWSYQIFRRFDSDTSILFARKGDAVTFKLKFLT